MYIILDLYRWTVSLYSKIKREGLVIEDLFEMTESEKSDRLANKLEECWKKEMERANKNGNDPSLLKALFQAFGFKYFLQGIMVFLQIMTR